eukprot:TRINITY_DN3508_c0_g1_i1.p1 TRINITY_DN3508_c0_g1~~TRINITY_DN3508_c0_g1_i1.p1  ORF type:complete len:1029 (+),score=138.02 TRINITY_DN3508_c0_g1_i1:124-3210(+)
MSSSAASSSKKKPKQIKIEYEYFGRGLPSDVLEESHMKFRDLMSAKQKNTRQSGCKTKPINIQKISKMSEFVDISQFSRIFIQDLIIDSVHSSKVFRAKIFLKACIDMEGTLHLLVHDVNQQCIQVSIINTGITDNQIAEKVFQEGYEIIIYEPFLKSFTGGGIGIVIQNPEQAYVGQPDLLEYENSGVDFEKHADLAKQNKNFDLARFFYTKALKNQTGAAQLLGNISACLLKQYEFLASLLYAYSSVRIDQNYAKGWYRISEALQKLDRLQELESTFHFAPVNMRQNFNVDESKFQFKDPKNNSCDAMQCFLRARILMFDLPRNKNLQETSLTNQTSIEQLKQSGNDHFRKQEISQALDFYLCALDLQKDKISALLKNRAECCLKTDNHLEAALDASVSLLLEYENNNHAVLLRACALREMQKFNFAIQFLENDLKPVNFTPLLKNFLKELKTMPNYPIPDIASLLDQQETRAVTLSKNQDNADLRVYQQQLQQFQQTQKLTKKEIYQQIDNIMYDSRVPNFEEEYLKGGYLPAHCDRSLCMGWLKQCQQESLRITKRLELEKFFMDSSGEENYSQTTEKLLPKRLGSLSRERLQWWVESEIGDISLMDRPGNAITSLQCFEHVLPIEMELRYGTVHVAVGYVDLGQLLTANICGEQTDPPLQFIGFVQSIYVTAKAAIIANMMGRRVDPKIILQVWYSSGWSLETLQQFRSTMVTLINDSELEEPVKYLLSYWLAIPRIPLKQSQTIWLRLHQEHRCLPANILKKQDRMELISYMLTGRLLECEVGSVVMFGNPPYFPPIHENERITWLLREPEIIDTYAEHETIIGTFVQTTLQQINALSELISNQRIIIVLSLRNVTPDDDRVHEEIKGFSPWSISWSNLVDCWGIKNFHKMAQACSAKENTVHFVHSLNWSFDMKGATVLDYPFKFQYDLYNDLCDGYTSIENDLSTVFLVPPVDNPLSLCDGYLSAEAAQNWAEKFFELGGVLDKEVWSSVSFPHSIFFKGQGHLFLSYTYDKNLDFTQES